MEVVRDSAERRRYDAAAIVRSCLEGRAFELDGDQAYIEQIHRCRPGAGSDVVVLRFEVRRSCLPIVRQAMQASTFVELVRRGRVCLLPEGAAFLQIMRRISDGRADGKELVRRTAVIRRLGIDAGQRTALHGRRRHRRRAHDDLVSCMPADGGASAGPKAMAGPARCRRATGK